ncbi:MAG: carbohydrate binding domain-containing protein [Methylomonas sp.]|jgi:hypothetical protein
MKLQNKMLIVALTALLPLSAKATTSICDSDPLNIVQNCGFETGDTTSWTQTGNWNTTYSYVNSSADGVAANSGNYALYVGNYAYQDASGVSQTFTDTVGAQYQLSFWVEENGSNTSAGTQLFTASVDGNVLFTLQDVAATPWTEYTVDFTGTGSDTIAFSGYSNAGYNGLDDVSADVISSSVPEPAMAVMWLFGSAFAGFVGFNRKKSV